MKQALNVVVKAAVLVCTAAALLACVALIIWMALLTTRVFADTLHWRANASVNALIGRSSDLSPIDFHRPHWEVILNRGFYDYTDAFLRNSRNILFCGRGQSINCFEDAWTRFFYMGVKSQSRSYTAASSTAVLYRIDLATPPTNPPTWVPIVPGNDGYIAGSISSSELPSSMRNKGVIFALIFPTHPTRFELTVASVSNALTCNLFQKVPTTTPDWGTSGINMAWQIRNPATSGAFQDISPSSCNMAHAGDWTFKMDQENLNATSFASIVDVPVGSRSSASSLFGRHVIYLVLSTTSHQNARNFKFKVGDWESGISYMTASTLYPPGDGYDVAAYPQSTAESSIAMAGELQAPIGKWTDNSSAAVDGLPDDSVCIAVRTLWPNYSEMARGDTNFVRMNIFGVTKAGDDTPHAHSSSNFPGSNWALQIAVQNNVGRLFRLRFNNYSTVRPGNAIDIPRGGETSALIVLIKTGESVRIQVFDFDYHHPTLGSGRIDERGYCSAIDNIDIGDPNFYADKTFTSSVPFGMSDSSHFSTMRYGDFGFSSADSSQGRGLSYRYPIWTQITLNLPGETTPRIDLRPWILDCKITGSVAPYASNNCGAPDTISHFIPVAQWRSNQVPSINRYPVGGYINVDGWEAQGTGETAIGGNSGNIIAPIDTGLQFTGVPTPGARLPGVQFIEDITAAQDSPVPPQYIFLMIGLSGAVFAIAGLQRLFGNILISVVGGGVVIALISTPAFGIAVIWVVVVYGIIGAAVVIIGDRVSTGY